MASHDINAKLKPYDEHVEGQSKLRGREQIARRIPSRLPRIPRKQRGLPIWSQKPEERRPHQNASDHFRDNLRLPELFCHYPDKSTNPENDCYLQEKLDGTL